MGGTVRFTLKHNGSLPAQSAALDQGQSSARATKPRRTGLLWM
jgi:hypothetical protein